MLRRRLLTQRLASAPLASAAEVVGLLGAVQAQERDQALWSLALRTRRATDASVRAELDSGAFVRTHVLRPTWHFVPVEDVRWMLALTGPRIERALSARHRQLGLGDPGDRARALDAVCGLLADRSFRTRREISAGVDASGVARGDGSWLGHVLLTAEVRGLICSGPSSGGEHTYALLDDVVPASDPLEDREAVRRLVLRFFRGHGPASVADFVRWSGLTGAEAKAALAELDGELAATEVDGVTLWGDPSVPRATAARTRAMLLPTYDELTLSYPSLPFPIVDEHPMAEAPGPYMSSWSYGTVLLDGVSIGAWQPRWRKGSAAVHLRLSARCTASQRRRVEAAVESVGTFLGRVVDLVEEC